MASYWCRDWYHEVMDAAQKSFISRSYWTERVGFVAALETLKVFNEQSVCNTLLETG